MAQNPGDVFIDILQISSPRSQSWNMAANFLTATVNETIFTPGVTAEIQIADQDDYLGQLKIAGDELVTFQFRKPDGAAAKYDMHLNSVKEVEIKGAMRTKVYKLDCVSRETLAGQGKYVQKAYNTTIDNIIQDLFKMLGSKLSIKVEPTKGKRNIKIANQPILHAIEMLRKQSVSQNNKSSNYMFWKTASGFHFKTMEELVQAGPVRTFKQDNTVGHSMMSDFNSNILMWKVQQNMDAFNRIKAGATNQRVVTFDIHTLQYNKQNMKKKQSEMKNLGKGLITGLLDGVIQGIERTVFRYVHANQNLKIDKSHVPEALPYKMMNLAAMQEQLMHMTVLGDPALEAGKTIACNVPKITSQTGNMEPEAQVSGKWLISKTQHVIYGPEVRPRFVTKLECLKGAFEESVGSAAQPATDAQKGAANSTGNVNVPLPTPRPPDLAGQALAAAQAASGGSSGLDGGFGGDGTFNRTYAGGSLDATVDPNAY